MRLRRLLVLLVTTLASAVAAQAPIGFLPVSGTKILSVTGVPVPRATLCAQVTYGSPNGASVNPAGGGQTTRPKQCVDVINGAFTINLPDTRLSLPRDVCVAITVTDPSYNLLLGPGYGCAQPTSAAGSNWCSLTSCNFDLYHPASPTLVAVSPGPLGPQGIPGPAGPQGLPGHCSDGTTLCPVSLHEAWTSQIGCAVMGADLASGTAYGTDTAATDDGPCISSWLNAHWSPAWFLLLHQDGRSVVSGIRGPTRGGWGIVGDSNPGFAITTVTGGTLSGNVLTLSTLPSSVIVGQHVILQNFVSANFLNRLPVLVTSASSTQFTATVVYANSTIDAGIAQTPTGNGFYQKAGTNDDVIHNGPAYAGCDSGYSDPGWIHPGPAPSRSSGILLAGLFINGNKGNGYNGNSTTGLTQGAGTYQNSYYPGYCSFMGVNIMNMNDVLIENVRVFNSSAYSVRGSNVGRFRSHQVAYDPMGEGVVPYAGNNDGLHISGPAEDIWSENDLFRTGDDAYCMCADEGQVGPIKRILISHPIFDGALSAGRLITHSIAPPAGDARPTVSDFRMTGGTGDVNGSIYNIGDEGAHTQTVLHSMWNIHYDHNDIRNVGTTQTDGVKIAENIDDITFDHETYAGLNQAHPSSPYTTYNDSHIGWMSLDNITEKRDATHHNNMALVNLTDTGRATIGRLSIHNSRIVDVDGGNYGPVQALVSASIASGSTVAVLEASGNEMSNIMDAGDDQAQFGLIAGDGPGRDLAVSNVALGAGAGGGTLDSVVGSDRSHTVLFTTGPTPTGSGILFTLNYTTQRPGFLCNWNPSNPAAAGLSGSNMPIIGPGPATGYNFYAGASLAPGTQYRINVSCHN